MKVYSDKFDYFNAEFDLYSSIKTRLIEIEFYIASDRYICLKLYRSRVDTIYVSSNLLLAKKNFTNYDNLILNYYDAIEFIKEEVHNYKMDYKYITEFVRNNSKYNLLHDSFIYIIKDNIKSIKDIKRFKNIKDRKNKILNCQN
jgi:hypothetical protein